VNNFLSNKLAKAIHDLVHDFKGLLLLELFAFDQLFKVAVLTVFGNDVETIFGTEHVLELDNVGVIEPFEEINLREYCIF
jgi:hypothetical protein